MTIETTFVLTYDPAKDGPLGDFRKKYQGLRAHVERMQAAGTLPRGHVNWTVRTKQPDPPPDATPTQGRVVAGPWLAPRPAELVFLRSPESEHHGPSQVQARVIGFGRRARMDVDRIAI